MFCSDQSLQGHFIRLPFLQLDLSTLQLVFQISDLQYVKSIEINQSGGYKQNDKPYYDNDKPLYTNYNQLYNDKPC